MLAISTRNLGNKMLSHLPYPRWLSDECNPTLNLNVYPLITTATD